MELAIELLLQIFLEAGFEGGGWLLKRRWGRLAVGLAAGFFGGFVWSVLVETHAPVVATAVIALQVALVPLLADREILGVTLRKSVLIDLAAIGAAVVAGRWAGWAGT